MLETLGNGKLDQLQGALQQVSRHRLTITTVDSFPLWHPRQLSCRHIFIARCGRRPERQNCLSSRGKDTHQLNQGLQPNSKSKADGWLPLANMRRAGDQLSSVNRPQQAEPAQETGYTNPPVLLKWNSQQNISGKTAKTTSGWWRTAGPWQQRYRAGCTGPEVTCRGEPSPSPQLVSQCNQPRRTERERKAGHWSKRLVKMYVSTGHREWFPDECQWPDQLGVLKASEGSQAGFRLQCSWILPRWTILVSSPCVLVPAWVSPSDERENVLWTLCVCVVTC